MTAPATGPQVREDEYLLLQAGAGDPEAFGRLYTRLAPEVARTATAILRDAEAGRDVCQEVFLRLWVVAPRYRPAVPVRAIARRLAGWKALSVLRARRAAAALAAAGPPRTEPPHGGPAGLGEALQRIPEEQGAAIRKRYLEDKSMDEIAGELGCPVGTVKSRLHHGLRKMRKEIGTQDRPA